MLRNDPLARLPEAPSSRVTSPDATDGGPLASAQYSGRFGVPGGEDASPQLAFLGLDIAGPIVGRAALVARGEIRAES